MSDWTNFFVVEAWGSRGPRQVGVRGRLHQPGQDRVHPELRLDGPRNG